MITPEQADEILSTFDLCTASTQSRYDAYVATLAERFRLIQQALSDLGDDLGGAVLSNQAERDQLVALLATITDAPCPVPLTYALPTDRTARPKPPLPTLGPANSRYLDPVFSTWIARMTDAGCVSELPGRSFRTPSSVHARAWNADGTLFYVVSTHGNIEPFALNRSTMRASRSGSEVRMAGEPNFHPLQPTVLVGAPNSATTYQIIAYDLAALTTQVLLDLKPLVSFDLANPRTYVGDTGISGDGTRIFAFFGGTGQDKHFLIAVKDVTTGQVWVLNTLASTLNGQPLGVTLGAHIHAASMDKSGRTIKISWASADNSSAPSYWHLDTGVFQSGQVATGGHDAFGYGYRLNQAAVSPYDAAQWQLRDLTDPLNPKALINPVLTPKAVYLADHPSWHHAQPDRLVPFLSGLYRYGQGLDQTLYPWRAWDDELVLVQTDVPAGAGATVWRACHHRSNVRYVALDGTVDASKTYFWSLPRPQISPDGRLALFTSNMEQTLGTETRDPGGFYRQDVFLVELP
jgi:hypothetical protein